ncbi:unnamed protein product [Psylliodes chrysocephalus]|uniref:Uncharacterized protein n=1 Tax=Psylliodes chrysocephalus TaxID=3402493 RepID=A0A9P0GE55_9CUCU|nr:unnamed protein product [Psylliodes chrysocephala]
MLKDAMENMLEKEIEVITQVKTAKKLGEKTYLVEFEKIEDTDQVNKPKNNKKDKIFINEDKTKMEREKEKQIRKTAKEEQDKGKIAKIGYNKVTIDGREWKWNYTTGELDFDKSKN